jgi:SAM-dependent methyltransferase
MTCRHCGAELKTRLIDLGSAPPSNAYLTQQTLLAPEKWYPLEVWVCETCWLVQTIDYAHHSEFFSTDYAYFSSFSSTWLTHARRYVDEMSVQFGLTPESMVIEVASNDGYLLQYVKALGIPCLGIEPTEGTAQAARDKGIDVVSEFFGVALAQKLAAQGKSADLMAANNVLAHVPDINDFVAGFTALLKPGGVATFEFPHLANLMRYNQFDTIYHEHFSYLSLTAVTRILAYNGLAVFDVAELPTHGGSLRVFAQRADRGRHGTSDRVGAMLEAELRMGIASTGFYRTFQARAEGVKNDFVAFLIDAKRAGKTVAAYGAAAKGNTFLNYAGVRGDLISYVVDRNPAKQGKFLPGSRIPVRGEEYLTQTRPDFIVILPWNLQAEVMDQLAYASQWGAQFVVAIPQLSIIPHAR